MKQFNFKMLAVFVLGIAVLGAVFFAAKQRVQKPETQGISPLSKEEILQSLSVPGQGTFSLEEKKKILENLSTPPGTKLYTEEEKKKILDSLSAPSQ